MKTPTLTTAGRTINILDLAAMRLPPAYIARACGCTVAHVVDVIGRFGGGAHRVLTVIVPRGVADELAAEAGRRALPVEQVAGDLLAEAVGHE